MPKVTRPRLGNGSRVAVIGGGPAGSLFSFFLLDMAERVGLTLQVDIYDPRDFDAPGPLGCNMCAGVLHESLVQSLATEGIDLPTTVVQRGLDSNVLHMDVGHIQIQTPRHEKRIATTYRGAGPRGSRPGERAGLDGHLIHEAVRKGANRIKGRIDEVAWEADPENSDPRARRLRIKTQGGQSELYDLVAVTVGVNTALLRKLEALDFGYQPPRTAQCRVRDYYLGEAKVTQYLGPAMHGFLLNIHGLDMGALVPKGDYMTLALIGENVDQDAVRDFVNHPSVKECLPPDFSTEAFSCSCAPRINVRGTAHPFGDRIVFIGDSGVTRLYKDGIGSAYRAAKVAARTAIFEGVSADDFRRHYLPFTRSMRIDNSVGALIFTLVRQIQKVRVVRHAVLGMVSAEQQGQINGVRGMSTVLWDMFTGSASYRDILLRTLHPAFWTRFLWNIALSIPPTRRQGKETVGTVPLSRYQFPDHEQPQKEDQVKLGALGKLYADGETIIRQGDWGDALFVIQEGQVEILEELDGKLVQLAVRKKGQFFGEMAIFERQVRSATVRALGPARVLTVDEKTLLRRFHEDPSLAYRMVRTMSNRVRELSGEVAQLKTSSRMVKS